MSAREVNVLEEAYRDRNRTIDAYVNPSGMWDWLAHSLRRSQALEATSKRLHDLLSQQPGTYPLHRMSFRTIPATDLGNFYYEYKVRVAGEDFTVVRGAARWEGIRVQRSSDGRRSVEVPPDNSLPIIQLPENTQILIHLRHRRAVDNPRASVEFNRLVGHWVPELSDQPRVITLPRGVQVQPPEDTSWPPPLIRDTLFLG